MYETGLRRKLRLISKVITPSTENLIITTHVLPYISRSKANQTRTFSQLKEYNMLNIFLKKLCTKCGGEISPKLFSRKTKLSISLDQHSDIVYSLLLSYVQVEENENIMKLNCFYIIWRISRIKKKSWDSVSCSFSAWFLKKTILTIYSVNWLNFIIWLSLLLNILDNMCIVTSNFLFPS